MVAGSPRTSACVANTPAPAARHFATVSAYRCAAYSCVDGYFAAISILRPFTFASAVFGMWIFSTPFSNSAKIFS